MWLQRESNDNASGYHGNQRGRNEKKSLMWTHLLLKLHNNLKAGLEKNNKKRGMFQKTTAAQLWALYQIGCYSNTRWCEALWFSAKRACPIFGLRTRLALKGLTTTCVNKNLDRFLESLHCCRGWMVFAHHQTTTLKPCLTTGIAEGKVSLSKHVLGWWVLGNDMTHCFELHSD